MTDTQHQRSPSRGRILALTAAAVLVPLNSTMIAVALPAIAEDFSVSTSTVSVLITTYLVIMFTVQPIAGRLGDHIGSKRLVQAALVGLAVMSIGAALAPTFALLVVARGVQALFAAALGPGTQSLLTQVTRPTERGRVFGVLGSIQGSGAALGPIVGGVLVQLAGWPAIFVVNVPIALATLYAIRSLEIEPTMAATAVDRPAGRIANPVFVASYAGQGLSTFGQYALLLVTPLVLDAQEWGAGAIGLALSALTIGMVVMGPVGGRLGDRVGRRRISMIGLALAAMGTAALTLVVPDVEPALLVVGLVVFGLGLGATTPNLMTAALDSVPPHRTGAAAGVLSTARYVGSIASTIVIATTVTDGADGSAVVLGVATLCLVASIATSTRLPGPRRA